MIHLLHKRFLRGHLSVQLGNIASNLSRLAYFITREMDQDAIMELFDESKVMIEWAAPSATLEQQFTLVELQRWLVHARFGWTDISTDALQRTKVVNKAQEWSDQLIAMSGLLNEDPLPTENQSENQVSFVATFS